MKTNNLRVKDLRKFGIILSIILAVLGGVHYLNAHIIVYPWFLAFAVAVMVLVAFVPKMLEPVYVIFIKVARAIGWFNTRVVLVMVYYLLITPIGFLLKVFKGDPLNRKIDKDADSYWIKRVKSTSIREDLEKQF